MFILSDARSFLKPYVDSGTCKNATIDARVNEATRRLLVKATWPMTERTMRVLSANKTFPLPREVEKVISADICGSPTHVWGSNYEFLDSGPGDLSQYTTQGSGKDLIDMGDGWPVMYDVPSTLTVDESTANSTDDIEEETGYYLMAFSNAVEDQNLSLTVRGNAFDGLEVFTGTTPGIEVALNVWKDGVEGQVLGALTSQQMSASAIRDIMQVYKPVTTGYVTLYACKPSTNYMYMLAKYHPTDTTPTFRRYRITNTCTNDDYANVYARVKLRYLPVSHEQDVLLIQNLDALKLMIMAITRENDGDIQGGIAYESQAVRLLNEQLSNYQSSGSLQVIDTESQTFLRGSPSIYSRGR
jgi:hypothetical protein